jgi:hypothetical protein
MTVVNYSDSALKIGNIGWWLQNNNEAIVGLRLISLSKVTGRDSPGRFDNQIAMAALLAWVPEPSI